MKNNNTNFTKEDIFNELDNIDNPYTFFPDFDNGYFYTSGSRISLYSENNRWAIVFEQSGYHNRNLDVEIHFTYFGNCLINLDKAEINNKYKTNIKYGLLIGEEKSKELEEDLNSYRNLQNLLKFGTKNYPLSMT